jgi:competence protein ComEA
MSEILVPNTWRDRLEALGGRRRDGLVLVAIAAGAVVIGVALWARGAPAAVAPPARAPRAAPAPSAAPSTVSASPAQPILVHVAGAVRRPGLYEMPMGARVADAVKAARGARPAADLDALNLAEPLVDGQKLEVLRRGQAPAALAASPVPSAPGSAAPISLNSADQAALETIPEIGPVTAAAILEYRAQIGSFTSIDQLLDVSGVGPATLEAMRPYVTL